MLGLQRIRNEKFNNWDSILAWLLKSALDTAVSFTYFELKLFLYNYIIYRKLPSEYISQHWTRATENNVPQGILTIKISL